MDHDFTVGASALRHLIDTTPIIDNHAHPMLKEGHLDKYPLLTVATEAHGDALSSTFTSLAHIRGVRQLAERLGCAQSWDAVEQAIKQRRKSDYPAWIRQCLSGIECVLVDDGLDNQDAVESYQHFDSFAPSASKRIVRIEQLAPKLIDEACLTQEAPEEAFEAAMHSFKQEIQAAIIDPEVVGFKSVICYRTGLDIPYAEDEAAARSMFASIHAQRRAPGAASFTRVNHRPLNEYLVHRLAQLIRDSDAAHKKPIQFHTGLGDNDLTLTRASPAHLQELARAYPTVPIVLLHSGYPFDRETGYMAAMYANVFADIGEVFPFINRDGQESILRHVLELCPWEKIIWSTDGHWFPETFFLSVVQMRDVFHTVLCDMVQKGDISWKQASQLVQDVLFRTSNKVYNLGLTLKSCEALSHARQNGLPAKSAPPLACLSAEKSHLQRRVVSRIESDLLRYLRLCWIDNTGTLRVKVIPSRQVKSILESNGNITTTIPKASLGQLQDDTIVADVGPAGHYILQADLSSLRLGPRDGHAMVMCDYREQDGSRATRCPRSLLLNAVRDAEEQHIQLKLGFEIELVFVRLSDDGKYELRDAEGHAWSSARAMDHEVVEKVLEPAIQQLEQAGVYVETLHAESAKGQYEVVLPPADPVHAVDTLVYAREVVASCARKHGYKMTLHPKPITEACGTAAHTHISVTPTAGDESGKASIWNSFYAGVLVHLRAICAFTYSNMASYERVMDGTWAGGTWVAWGTQNREVPLRKIQDGHWEVRCVDGLANPYLAMMAIIVAGLEGVKRQEKLVWGDCTKDPGSLFWEERLNLGINSNLPATIEEALVSLEEDTAFVRAVGEHVVSRYVAVKKAETKKLKSMETEKRKKWIIDRY